MYMPGCPYPGACGMVGQTGCVNCVSRENTSTCPNPGTCGFAYIPSCTGCVSGQWEVGCPFPDHCGSQYAALPNCGGCVENVSTSACPDPSKCGLGPLPPPNKCQGCMCDMYMDTCPDPAACGLNCNNTCMMESTFGFSHDVCILFQKWHVADGGTYAAAVIGILVLCAIREWLSVHRTWVAEKCKQQGVGAPSPINALNSDSDSGEIKGQDRRCRNNAINAVWYLFGLLAAYLIMLVIMTYEAGLFLTVVLGCGLFHFVFHMLYEPKVC